MPGLPAGLASSTAAQDPAVAEGALLLVAAMANCFGGGSLSAGQLREAAAVAADAAFLQLQALRQQGLHGQQGPAATDILRAAMWALRHLVSACALMPPEADEGGGAQLWATVSGPVLLAAAEAFNLSHVGAGPQWGACFKGPPSGWLPLVVWGEEGVTASAPRRPP